MHPDTKLFSEKEAATLLEIMLHRRDTRGNRFVDRPLEEQQVQQLLTAATHAPSVGFSQPWEFVLIRDKDIRQQVKQSFTQENAAARDAFTDDQQQQYIGLKLEGILEAPLNIAVFYRPAGKPVLGQTSINEVGLYSVVCAIQNMWLMARALNIGMGWVSILDPVKVNRILNAPPGNQLVAYLCLGYTDGFYTQPELEILQWEKRKQQSAIVLHERYPDPSAPMQAPVPSRSDGSPGSS
ncbi:MAG TPA: 5,6-dimethylbenzimidazole synthase [Puia sp.]